MEGKSDSGKTLLSLLSVSMAKWDEEGDFLAPERENSSPEKTAS